MSIYAIAGASSPVAGTGIGVTSSQPVGTCSAIHRSWAFCRFNHKSGVVPKARDRRKAMSGVTPARSLTILESVLRDTPRTAASCVTVRCSGSMCILLMMPPGCVGFRVIFRRAGSMVVEAVNIVGVSLLHAEGYAPVPGHLHGPEPGTVPLEGMQTGTGKGHVARLPGLVQAVQNIRQLPGVLGLDAACGPVEEQVFQALVLEALNHPCNHQGYGCQRERIRSRPWLPPTPQPRRGAASPWPRT